MSILAAGRRHVSWSMKSIVRSFGTYSPIDGVVEPSWVEERLGKVRLLDATLHLDPKRNALEEYKQKHIPGSLFFNIDKVADCQLQLPHMIPTPTYFKKCVEEMGLNHTDEIVVYDTHGLFSSTRAWYMFKLFNPHTKVYVLNGGFVRWQAENRPVESGEVAPVAPGRFHLRPNLANVLQMDEVLDLVDEFKAGRVDLTVVDARPAGRFNGEVPEARPGLFSGHMPGSKNLPFTLVCDAEDHCKIKPPGELRKLFEDIGVDLKRKQPIVFSCGSGTTACVDLFAAHLAGRDMDGMRLYDGSWAEYGKLALNNPVVTK